MKLDFNSKKETFILWVDRGEADPAAIQTEQGWDFSTPASTGARACLFTRCEFAAAAYGQYATAAAAQRLGGLLKAIALSWQQESNVHIKIPADQELMPFQKAGVEYALQRKNTLLGDQMGLGKTMQAIAYCNEVQAQRVLVICPAAVRRQWVKQIRAWSTMPWPNTIYCIENGRHGVHPSANYTVISYDLAGTPGIGNALAKGSYDVLILDEAHYLKTIDTKRTRAVFGGGDNPAFEPFSRRSESILALTGTPLPNRPREAYTLARGMCFESIDWMSEESFSTRFNPSARIDGRRQDGTAYTYTREEVGRVGELQSRLRSSFMVRRLKRDVYPQLDLPSFSIMHMEETGEVRAALKAESLLEIDPENMKGLDMTVLGAIATVRRMMGVALAPLVAEYAKMVLDGGEEKLFIVAHHIEVMDIIEAALRKYSPVRIDGSTSMKQREKRVETFRTEPRCHVILGNIQSIGTGVDGLQDVCSHGIGAEASWVSGENDQWIARLNRIGQKAKVQIDMCVAAGSMTEKVLATAIRKGQNTHKALDATM